MHGKKRARALQGRSAAVANPQYCYGVYNKQANSYT